VTGVTTALSICGALVFLAYELVLRRRDADAATWRSDDGDRGTTRLILGAYVAVVAINVALGRAAHGHVAPIWRWAGVALLAAGLALRAWAMRTLGRHSTRTLRAVEEQQVVDRGPYRLVRHPGYTGSLLVWTGYALGLGSWLATAATAGLLGAVYLRRIDAEEALLRSALGERYVAYEHRTKRLVPFVY
jgi:protein-S-isoprenylcysteine O-methyltransferase